MKNSPYQQSKLIYYYRLRVSKADSSFLYFTLEANEGIAFYSTLEESLGTSYRDIECQGAIEYQEQFLNIIKHLEKSFPIEILEQSTIKDS